MKNKGFTLIEVLVVSGLMIILALSMFSLFMRSWEKARKVTCVSNLKQVALSMLMYARDWDDKFVPGGYSSTLTGKAQAWWDHGKDTPLAGATFGSYPTALYSYIDNIEYFHCPEDINYHEESGPTLSYAGNGGCTPETAEFDCASEICPDIAGVLSCGGRSFKEIPDPANTILLGCLPLNPANKTANRYIDTSGIDCFTMSPPGPKNYILCWMGAMCGPDTVVAGAWDGGDNEPAARLIHNGGANWAFCDGRVKWLRAEQTIEPRNLWLKDSTGGEHGWDPYGNFKADW
jgi:prepilin-type processing-associated H-X9-DG protein